MTVSVRAVEFDILYMVEKYKIVQNRRYHENPITYIILYFHLPIPGDLVNDLTISYYF